MMLVGSEGPINSRIMIVGEAPGVNEERKGRPFIGQSGEELTRMLGEAGINRLECRLTNVIRIRPERNKIDNLFYGKKEGKAGNVIPLNGRYPKPIVREHLELLRQEILVTKPDTIIALGGAALWALTGFEGIRAYRGGVYECILEGCHAVKVVPTYHPALVLRQWSNRKIAVHDMRRALSWSGKTIEELTPDYNFLVRPSFEAAMAFLKAIPDGAEVAADIETRQGHIACIGFATDTLTACCIPFMCIEDESGYWDEQQEIAIVMECMRVLTKCSIIGQNFHYDEQYIGRFWGIKCNTQFDTMLAQHVCFAGLPKSLDFLSSMYCAFHQYWKADGKEWIKDLDEDKHWVYNCKDAVITFESKIVLDGMITQMGLREPFNFQMYDLYPAVFELMLRGVRVDDTERAGFQLELLASMTHVEEFFVQILGHNLNPRSSQQMQRLFYEDLNQKVILHKDTKRPTCNTLAMETIAKRQPLLAPLCWAVEQYRTMGIFLSTFVQAELDIDKRLRCQYKMAGTETYRFASSKSAFNIGTNLQNIPNDKDELRADAPAWQRMLKEDLGLALPAIRKLFIPDPGYLIADIDLDRADAQVVAWEADDPILKQMFREGVDLHSENAKAMGVPRPKAKAGIHAINYGVQARTLASTLGITVAEAEAFINRWFQIHPWIAEWHERTMNQLMTSHTVQNAFGYRRFYFDRPQGLLPEALAWVPQSTVALVINKAMVNLRNNLSWCQSLLQVHDSLVVQFPRSYLNRREEIQKEFLVEVPYEDPLVIPVGMKVSDKSWGHCEEIPWKDAV